jgi:hypothetical protein
MATAESNALLAQQLFMRPAEEYADRSNQRLRILLGIAQAEREEQLRRDMAAQQASREDARWKAQGEREDARIKASDDRQARMISEAERRQTAAAKEKDRADIENEFDRLYPQYAQAAALAQIPIKERSAYETSRAGLGQLAADLKAADVGYRNRQLELSADASISELEDKRSAIEEAKKRTEALSKPTPEDEKIARQNAVSAVRTAIEQGDIESTKKLSRRAVSDGLAALASGDDAVARRLLGDEAIRAYEYGFEQTLMQLPNTKARMQEQRLVHQEYQSLLGDMRRTESDLRRAQVSNPYLATKLKDTRAASMQQLMGVPAEKPRALTFDDITPPRRTAGSGGPAPIISIPEPTPPAAPPNIFNMMGGLPLMRSTLSAPIPAPVPEDPLIRDFSGSYMPAPVIDLDSVPAKRSGFLDLIGLGSKR